MSIEQHDIPSVLGYLEDTFLSFLNLSRDDTGGLRGIQGKRALATNCNQILISTKRLEISNDPKKEAHMGKAAPKHARFEP